MDTSIQQYISKQSPTRQIILETIHAIILEEDKTVVPTVALMMGKEMIVYKAKGLMKYALAGVKNYMSLHVMPIYGSKTLFSKYESLLPKANFQKGCINFRSEEEVPLEIVRQLISDCSRIDLMKMRQDYLQQKKRTGKSAS